MRSTRISTRPPLALRPCSRALMTRVSLKTSRSSGPGAATAGRRRHGPRARPAATTAGGSRNARRADAGRSARRGGRSRSRNGARMDRKQTSGVARAAAMPGTRDDGARDYAANGAPSRSPATAGQRRAIRTMAIWSATICRRCAASGADCLKPIAAPSSSRAMRIAGNRGSRLRTDQRRELPRHQLLEGGEAAIHDVGCIRPAAVEQVLGVGRGPHHLVGPHTPDVERRGAVDDRAQCPA